MKTYLDEDMKDYAVTGTNARLMKKLEAAMSLFPDERKLLQREYLNKL